MPGQSGVSSYATPMLADSGNPWALPAPQPDPYSESAQPYQRGSHFITPEEMNSIYKQHDQAREQTRDETSTGRRHERRNYSPGTSFDPLLPGTMYPGVEGGIYSPYGMSPFYTPYNYNNVAPFIY
ncbi:MAG: hypothetical protein WBN96_08580 [Gammaproteobacteria bacterium]